MCCRRQQNFRFRTIRNNACPEAVDAPRFFNNNARHRRRRRGAHRREKRRNAFWPSFARVNALIPFCRWTIPVLQHFIAASCLTAATVTRRAASTSEWKIRVFTGGTHSERMKGWRHRRQIVLNKSRHCPGLSLLHFPGLSIFLSLFPYTRAIFNATLISPFFISLDAVLLLFLLLSCQLSAPSLMSFYSFLRCLSLCAFSSA